MSDSGLDIILTWLDENARDLAAQAHAEIEQAQGVCHDLDSLEVRLARLRNDLDIDVPSEPSAIAGFAGLDRPASVIKTSPEWEALRAQAQESLRSRGVDPSTVDLDSLLDPEEVQRIARRFSSAFSVRAHLDRYDLAITLVAGLTAALVDWLVVNGAPTSLQQLRDFHPKDDGLTAFFQHNSLDSNNKLGRMAKASFDRQRDVSGSQLPGFGPNTHRGITLGHDSLFTLAIGTRDVMRGEMTIVAPGAHVLALPTTRAPVTDPLDAVRVVMLHMLSDAFTTRGVQAPGWTLVNALPLKTQSGGTSYLGLGASMYGDGYETRHFLTMGTPAAAAETILRSYWLLRRDLDDEYAEDVRREAQIAGCGTEPADHPRYLAMSFGAHALACAADAGKVILSGNNLLLVNLPEWQVFLMTAIRLAKSHDVSPTDIVIRTGLSNVEALANGWPDIDANDPRLPTLQA